MFMIVFSHVIWEGNFTYPRNVAMHNVVTQIPWLFGQIGVIAFTLISAYFLSKSSKVKINGILNIGKVTWSWSIIILISAWVFRKNLDVLNLKLTIKSIFPILMGTYWYVTAYIALYLIFPYLNIVINKLDKSEYNKFLLVLIVIFSIVPTFTGASSLNSTNAASSVFSLIVVYFIGGYIRKYEDDIKVPFRRLIIVLVLSLFLSILILILLNYANKYGFINITGVNRLYGRFMRTNSIFQIISGTTLFLIFRELRIKYSKTINNIATKMFGVYIIHTNPIIIIVLWGNLVRINRFEFSNYILIYEFVVAVCVYLICIILEYIRELFFSFSGKVFTSKQLTKGGK